MRYRRLGASALEVSEISLGTWLSYGEGPERQKHVSDFEAILGLLKNVYGVAFPDPNA